MVCIVAFIAAFILYSGIGIYAPICSLALQTYNTLGLPGHLHLESWNHVRKMDTGKNNLQAFRSELDNSVGLLWSENCRRIFLPFLKF